MNRELANLEDDLMSTDMNEGYATWSKLKNNSSMCEAEENSLLPSQTIPSDDTDEALAGAATAVSLLSPFY